MGLVGMFFSRRTEEFTFAGEVVEEPTPGHFLVKMDVDPRIGVAGFELVSAFAMGDPDDGEDRRFFQTRAYLDRWLEWLSEPCPECEAEVGTAMSRALPQAARVKAAVRRTLEALDLAPMRYRDVDIVGFDALSSTDLIEQYRTDVGALWVRITDAGRDALAASKSDAEAAR